MRVIVYCHPDNKDQVEKYFTSIFDDLQKEGIEVIRIEVNEFLLKTDEDGKPICYFAQELNLANLIGKDLLCSS